MAKKIVKKIKLVIPAGKATPAPPVGPTLGAAGINIGQFVPQFNEGTKDMVGMVPVIISVHDDRTFSLEFKTAPASDLLIREAGIEKGSDKAPSRKVGSITKAQLRSIAEKKIVDLNANDVDAAMNTIAGTARSMGIDIK